MAEKRKCEKCGLLIDDDMEYCPYCGYKQENITLEDKNKSNKDNENNKKESLLHFPSRVIYLPRFKNIYLFLVGFLGLQILSLFLSLILISLNQYLGYFSSEGTALLNFSTYLVVFGILILIIGKDFNLIFPDFKKGRTYLYGITYGLMLIVISSLVSNIFHLIFSVNSSNNNQQQVESVVTLFPLASTIIFGIVGPICEEFTYRLGLFTPLVKRLKPVFAYIIVALIFGFLHFDFSVILSNDSSLIINELVNIPSYVVSGLLLTYFYHKEGIVASSFAHITNNLFSIIVTLFL